MLQLNNPETASKFEAATEHDQHLDVPVNKGNCNCKSYTGMLSNITPCAAERYVVSGGNLLIRKVQSEEIINNIEDENENFPTS